METEGSSSSTTLESKPEPPPRPPEADETRPKPEPPAPKLQPQAPELGPPEPSLQVPEPEPLPQTPKPEPQAQESEPPPQAPKPEPPPQGPEPEPSPQGPGCWPTLELTEVPDLPSESIAVGWGRGDASHAAVGRVELQVWYVEGGQLKTLLDQLALSSLQIKHLGERGSVLLGSVPVCFGEAAADMHDEEGQGVAMVAKRLLKSKMLQAHTRTIHQTAPIVLEGMPPLYPVALRLRLYASGTASQGDRSRRAAGHGSRSRCSAWGPPLLLMRLPATGPVAAAESASAALRLVPFTENDEAAGKAIGIQVWR